MGKVNRAIEYGENQIKSAGKIKTLQLLHEGGIRFLKKALENPNERDKNLIKTQNILAQLQLTLRPKEEVAELLLLLYDYMYELLEKKDNASIKDVIMLFEHLLHTTRLLSRKRG